MTQLRVTAFARRGVRRASMNAEDFWKDFTRPTLRAHLKWAGSKGRATTVPQTGRPAEGRLQMD